MWIALAITFGKVSAFVVLMVVVGRRVLPRLLWLVARTGSRELFTLCVIAAAVGVAYGSAALFDVSFALGAFFAGMMMRESELSHRAAEESLPLRDAFAVLFFVSVGMLFDPQIVIDEPLRLLAVVAIVMVGNPLVAIALVLVFRYPLNTALTVGASVAQIGEFSFILAALGVSLALLPAEGQSLIVAGALLSITANPLVFAAMRPALAWIRARSGLARRLERSGDPLGELPTSVGERYLAGQVVLVGYGRVGRRIGQVLSERGIPLRGRRAESRAGRAAAQHRYPVGIGRCLAGFRTDSGAYRQREAAWSPNPRNLSFRQEGQNPPNFNPGDRDLGAEQEGRKSLLRRKKNGGLNLSGKTGCSPSP